MAYFGAAYIYVLEDAELGDYPDFLFG